MLIAAISNSAGQPQNVGGVTLRVVRHRWGTHGGPLSAEIEATGDENALWKLSGMLGYRISIISDRGDPVWWGVVDELAITIGAIKVGFQLENMVNKAAVAYTVPDSVTGRASERRTTAWAQNDDSVAKYGEQQLLYSLSSATDAQALATRDALLSAKAAPVPAVEPLGGGAERVATITCVGYYELLNRRYYSAAASNVSYLAVPAGVTVPSAVDSQTVSYGLTLSEDASFAIGTSTRPYATFTFKLTGTQPMQFKKLKLKTVRAAAPGDSLVAELWTAEVGATTWTTANAGSAIWTKLGEASLAAANVPTANGWVDFAFNSHWVLPGVLYRIHLRRSGSLDNTNFYYVMAHTALGYADGISYEYTGSVWQLRTPNADILFEATAEVRDASVDIGAVASRARIAASFVVPGSQPVAIGTASAVLARFGNPTGNISGFICQDTAGAPGAVIDTVNVPCSAIPTEPTRITFTMPNNVLNTNGLTRWWQLWPTYSNDPANFVRALLDSTLSNSTSDTRLYTGSAWVARSPDADMWFEIIGTRETTVQMAEIIAAAPFLAGSEIELSSGVFTTPFRNGDSRSMDVLEDLLAAGTAVGQRLMAMVTADRKLRVLAEPTLGQGDYFLNRDGRLTNAMNVPAVKERTPVGVWVRPRDFAADAAFAIFIDQSEYMASGDKLTLKAREASSVFDLGKIKQG